MVSLSYEEYKEVGIDPSFGYNPDIGDMLKYEGGDRCVLVTARYDGVLVGYALYAVGPFKHNKDIEYASLEAIYLSPAFRSGFTAMHMVKLGEKEVRKYNIKFISAASSIKCPIDALLKRQGYEPLETVYIKKV